MQSTKDFVFFTLNDFSKDGGGTIRMKGIVDALAHSGKKVTLLSNAKKYDVFHPLVEHVFIDMTMSKKDKRVFQFCLSLLPMFLTKQIFSHYGRKLKKIIDQNVPLDNTIIYFEHIDNSMAYFLHEQKIIENYINDTHGIAPLEFLHKQQKGLKDNIVNTLKYIVSLKLDKKVMSRADSMIFLSQSMKNYFEKNYGLMSSKENYILCDGVNRSLCHQTVDDTIVEKYKKNYNILPKDKVVMFAGSFKDLGGVLDLLQAFYILVTEKKRQDVKLLLLGDGERYQEAKKFVHDNVLVDKVIFVGRTMYTELSNFQELADVIVCPDKQHPFSELVPHIKYFDSLASGKVVVNGSFTSVKEINHDEKFSIYFEPSNIIDLAGKIEMVLQDLEYFTVKYRDNKKIVCSKFTYDHNVKVLLK